MREVLSQVQHLTDGNNPEINQVSVETALKAMREYHKQFSDATIETELESKILEAKSYGISFVEATPNIFYTDRETSITITKGLTTEEFEAILDKKLKYFHDRDFMKILKKHNLLIK